MITRTQSYQTSDGKTFAELSEAQAHEINIVFESNLVGASEIVRHSKQIVDILTTGPNSRPPARAVNGGRKPRKAKANPVPAPAPTESPATEPAAN